MSDEFVFFRDDFPETRPGGPQGRDFGRDIPLSEWGMLARGKTLGKTVNIFYVPADLRSNTPASLSPANMFELKGEDEHALPLMVNIAPPKYYPYTDAGANPITANTLEGASGSIDNIQGLTDINVGGAGPVFGNPIALLDWGIGGTFAQAVVDIVNGCCVNVNASWIRVRGAIEKPWVSVAAFTSPLAYSVGAFVGPGMPRAPSAQRTLYIETLADGITSDMIPIPQYAKKVYVMGNPATAGATLFVGQIDFFRNNTGVLTSGFGNGRFFISGNNPTPTPIPNGSYYLRVTNRSGETCAPLSIVFELSI